MAVFKTNLKRLMLQKSVELDHQITQKEVAEATGLSLPTVYRWYQGEVDKLDALTASKFVNYLGCTFNDLVALED